MPDTHVCGHCFHIYVEADARDPIARIAKEIEIARHETFFSAIRTLSMLVPGLPLLLDGKPVTGSFAMFFAWFAATLALFPVAWLRDAVAPGVGTEEIRNVTLVFALVFGYAMNLMHGLSQRARRGVVRPVTTG